MEHSGGGRNSSSGRDQMQHLVAVFKTEPSHDGANVSGGTMDPAAVARKRAQDESADVRERIAAVKKRILEHKHLRLKSVKERHAEHVAEWFFLQSGGNLMDYQVWRKKPQTPELINFMRLHRLEGPSSDDANQMNMSSNPAHGTEIKIPGVGATPVAVSTQLPAAVVQLSQLGHVPGRPQGGRHGMVFGQIPVSTPSSGTSSVHAVPGGFPLVPDADLLTTPTTTTTTATPKPVGPTTASKLIGGVLKHQQGGQQSPTHLSFGSMDHLTPSVLGPRSPALTPGPSLTPETVNSNGATSNGNNPDQFSVKAKQEVYVLQRVTELQREGLWPEKRLPKLQEPTRPKAHWDYLLEEMAWLSADFAQERKWKKAAAKKCARMVQKYFQDKAMAAQKAEKLQELQLKRIAAFLAKEIKTFWSSVEKLVEFKQQTRLEEKKKAALDQHLSFIVDQTEKLTEQLTEGMNKAPVGSLNSSRRSSPRPGRSAGSDDEFTPNNVDSSDDEETIAKEEAETAPDVKAEVLALQRESEMDLDDFLKELPKDYLANRDKIVLPESDTESAAEEEEDKEFQADENSEDDEDTIREQEKNEKVDHKREIAELNEENEMSIEQLMEKYKNLAKQHGKAKDGEEAMEVDSSSGDNEEEVQSTDVDDGQSEQSEEEDEEEAESSEEEEEETSPKDETEELGLKNLMNESAENKDQLIDDAAALAQSIQPKGNTLSSTNVVTEVPFLLKHTLREYQHIGLDWLVTMHDRKLNGILADEMGLGKTIQTIALLAHLACVKGDWGPHLIIVPSSVMLNWEMEFKRWCPGFKILTYYGAQKERKAKRVGWTKVNAFHVCITSYKLVIQDHQSFRRKKWKYLILDEAQNIKNFKSQRWQLLLNFQTEQRLLLTGTPLQNNLMELWSLMHFLMPHVFQSHREFKEWFSNPMTGMIEGNSEYNESIVKRLHKVLRPFLLRRLKSEVEKQMPKKYEHVVMCRLSKRQRYLYDDFMSRAKTRETLATGNLLSVINVLMQLRKVCNHPNLFEVRPTISPFRMDGIQYKTASLVTDLFRYDPLKDLNLQAINLDLMQLELSTTAYMAYRCKKLSTPKRLIEEIDEAPELPPSCPSGRFRMHIKVKPESDSVSHSLGHSQVRPGTSPAMKIDGNRFVLLGNPLNAEASLSRRQSDALITASSQPTVTGTPAGQATASGMLVKAPNGRHYLIPATSMPSVSGGTTTHVLTTQNGQRVTVVSKNQPMIKQPMVKLSPIHVHSQPLAVQVAQQLRNYQMNQAKATTAAAMVDQESANESEDMDTSELDLKEFVVPETEEAKRELRINQLKNLNRFNEKHCDASPIFGADLRDCMINLFRSESRSYRPWIERSYETCLNAMWGTGQSSVVTWPNELLKTVGQRTQELKPVFENFVTFVPSVSAPAPILHVSHPDSSTVIKESHLQTMLREDIRPSLNLLHPIMSAMSTQFPDPRLIQYDCGKLQTLDKLLRRLKTGGHKVLIFTQMTRMLDVLEAFLNYHGHIYLRLDGTTKVEQRQVLMERFNGDKRIFAFILSTRSGGVGVNLTGADTVIFYDSDWNPTMDAQAQDRCHRIGQTRDVHIYRLVSEKTVEENILKKANQKRLLGDLAIEGGNFTTAYFKSSTIQDLFQTEAGNANTRMQELLEMDRVRRERLNEAISAAPSTSQAQPPPVKDSAFVSALQAAEDEQDVEAAKTAQAEVDAELAEFDENIPIEEDGATKAPELSKAEMEVENLVKQLSPIERYAMKFVEETGGQWAADKLRMAEADFEQQKREWEANRQAALKKAEEDQAELQQQMEEDDYPLTYSSEDAKNQIWISENTGEQMPMWCPPTPPQDDNDIYTDHSLAFLYEPEVMSESQLPPVYVRKEYKRSRLDAGLYDGNKRPIKFRKEDLYQPPKSLFDRPSPALAKIRRDLKLQRYRGTLKSVHLPNLGLSSSSIAMLKPNQLQKPLMEPEGMSEWFIYEDMAMLNVIQNLQGLPLNLMVLSPGHTVNWDLVADIVNQSSRTYRSPKQCRYRYEAVVVPREEGKLIEAPKKQKKNKPMKNPLKNGGGSRCPRTSQVFGNDNNSSFTKLLRLKIDTMKNALGKKQMPIRHRYTAATTSNTLVKNPKHADVLTDHGIFNYDCPMTPADIVQRKFERITKEKQKHMGNTSVGQVPDTQNMAQHKPMNQMQGQQHLKPPQAGTTQAQEVVPVMQQQQQQQQQQSAGQTVVIQQHAQPGVTPTGNIALVQTPSTIQNIRHSTGIQIAQQSPQQQIMKAIVTSSPVGAQNLLASQVQQITVQQQQSPVQSNVAGGQSGGAVVVPSSVSVVLTNPVSTLSSGQQQSQIVSIQPTGTVTTTMTTQSGGSIVHTLSSATAGGVPQKMTVQQLAQQISSGTLQTNTIPASSLRAQRIVQGGLQEVVLHQRTGTNQSPTVVSVSNLGQGLTQAQLQTQLRLQMAAGGQPVSGVVAKGITVAAAAAAAAGANKAGGAQQLQFYRQQPIRQQLKVLHTTPTGPNQSTSGVPQGQTTLVSPSGTIFQGGIVQTSGGALGHQTVQVQQTASGQKVAVVSGTNTGAGVATVQVASPGRTQFIKQITSGKQTIARPVTEGEMQTLVVKRQFISQQPQQQQQQQAQGQGQVASGQHKTQVISQAQIYAPATVQVQTAVSSAAGSPVVVTQGGQVTAGSSAAGQIAATLVKTSTGAVATGGSPTAMTFSQVKPGQIKMTNSVRQLQMQQQMYQAQRKAAAVAAATGKASPITQLPGKAGMATQLIVNSKTLPVAMQQFQVIRHAQPGTLATAGLVLSKNMGRMIPASSQPNSRPTIQVVTATSSAGQALSGNLRATHVTTSSLAGTLQGAIKVASGAASAGQAGAAAGGSGAVSAQQQQQQALLTALQNQNVSPVRLQTSGGSLVAVTVQQSPTLVSGGQEMVQQGVQGSAAGQGGPQSQNQQQQ